MAMRPPNSPRETRRSVRRSGPSASSSTSKSPHSPPPESPSNQKKEPRPALSTANSSSRNRRFKQEEIDDDPNDKSIPPIASTAPTPARAKRKGKEKEKHSPDTQKSSQENNGSPQDDPEVDEEASVTRCVCEDDPDAGEFMVQCEKCQVWQHGLCMGYESEDKLNASLPLGASYFCELCSPELHASLLQKLSKKARHSSTTSARNSVSAPSRLSRSHSPTVASKQPHKRRSTMNSRFDESLKEIIEATAAEAAAADPRSEVALNGEVYEPEESENTRNKRKRTEEDAPPKKRTRSASTASEIPIDTTAGREDTPTVASSSKPIPPNPRGNGRAKRGGARRNVVRPESVDGEQPISAPKRSTNNRSRAGGAKRPPASNQVASSAANVATAASGSVHEHGTRRTTTGGPSTASTLEASRAYRSSHAYIVSQQPLHTSWNLPDYLPQLAHMLPTETPIPLLVRAGGLSDALDRTAERGVKVKWPSKRMSVGDMNKRVRSLSEWCGREQAGLADRTSRREALSMVLRSRLGDSDRMILDVPITDASPVAEDGPNDIVNGDAHASTTSSIAASISLDVDHCALRSTTDKMLTDLMQELIGFQERFGPGARTRERRMAAAS